MFHRVPLTIQHSHRFSWPVSAETLKTFTPSTEINHHKGAVKRDARRGFLSSMASVTTGQKSGVFDQECLQLLRIVEEEEEPELFPNQVLGLLAQSQRKVCLTSRDLLNLWRPRYYGLFGLLNSWEIFNSRNMIV
ncbi:hypothetical protein RRG08_029653 [Elysia crispata]|uniref:Uncharacterized protein n=1 Tax=Elysia crispata TaxID=231223 RepID=A0AAE0XPR1_9GAST|nr:hypothetical protein RRG08_029653 [Elysia crispata]